MGDGPLSEVRGRVLGRIGETTVGRVGHLTRNSKGKKSTPLTPCLVSSPRHQDLTLNPGRIDLDDKVGLLSGSRSPGYLHNPFHTIPQISGDLRFS